MAEFCDVARAYIRMCDSFGSVCSGCPIDVHGNDIYVCRNRVLKDPQKYEAGIMAWAAEHPESVYPTWYEYLFNVTRGENKWPVDDHKFCQWLDTTCIPADIAQKLGIEPKEG